MTFPHFGVIFCQSFVSEMSSFFFGTSEPSVQMVVCVCSLDGVVCVCVCSSDGVVCVFAIHGEESLQV